MIRLTFERENAIRERLKRKNDFIHPEIALEILSEIDALRADLAEDRRNFATMWKERDAALAKLNIAEEALVIISNAPNILKAYKCSNEALYQIRKDEPKTPLTEENQE